MSSLSAAAQPQVPHVIRRVTVELFGVKQCDGHWLHERISQWASESLPNLLDTTLSEYLKAHPALDTITIERLEVNVGRCEPAQLVRALAGALPGRLAAALAEEGLIVGGQNEVAPVQLITLTEPGGVTTHTAERAQAGSEASAVVPREPGQWFSQLSELRRSLKLGQLAQGKTDAPAVLALPQWQMDLVRILEFLEHGSCLWNTPNGWSSIDACRQLLTQYPDVLGAVVRGALRSARSQRRVILQWPVELRRDIWRQLVPETEFETWDALLRVVPRSRRSLPSNERGKVAIGEVCEQWLVGSSLGSLGNAGSGSSTTLAWQRRLAKAPSEVIQALARFSWSEWPKVSDGVPSRLRLRAGQLVTAIQTVTAMHASALATERSMSEPASDLAPAGVFHEQAESGPSRVLESTEQGKAPSATKEAGKGSLDKHGTPRLLPESEELETPPHLNRTSVESAAQTETRSSPRDASDEEVAWDDYRVPHAGVVLLWPYLPEFLRAMGLIQKGKLEPAQRERAVQLLHFVATEECEAPEQDLLLPKLLTGMPLKEPVRRSFEISIEERKQVDELLGAVIGNWKSLGKTSVGGLRQSFIQRPGVLALADEGATLIVERKSFDLLLERLPWSLSMIKLSWMAEVLRVQW